MYIDAATILDKLRTFCSDFKKANPKADQKKIAKALGVTPSQLSLTINGKTNVIPARILKKLGYQAVVAYVPAGRTATKKVKVARDSTSGKTVSKAYAKNHPKTTTVETVKVAVKPKPKKTAKKAAKRSPKNAALRKHVVNEAVKIDVAAAGTPATVIDVMARD